MPQAEPREARLQDITNRQHSLPNSNTELQGWWLNAQVSHQNSSRELYELALAKGIAKEVARSVLPEGLTMSRMYASGSLRSWIHYTELRCDEATQADTARSQTVFARSSLSTCRQLFRQPSQH